MQIISHTICTLYCCTLYCCGYIMNFFWLHAVYLAILLRITSLALGHMMTSSHGNTSWITGRCEGNRRSVTGGFPSQRANKTVFYVSLNKLFSNDHVFHHGHVGCSDSRSIRNQKQWLNRRMLVAKFPLVVVGVAFTWLMYYVLNYANDKWVAVCSLPISTCEIS